jgi:hypothetical protein
MNKPITLEELSEIFKEGFERTYAEYHSNTPEVKGALEASNPRFLEEYFFNNGIKYLMEKMRELQKDKTKE